MASSPIRWVQCPYCKKKFGIQPDQPLTQCFFCGGALDVQPRVKKNAPAAAWLKKSAAGVGALLAGTTAKVKSGLQAKGKTPVNRVFTEALDFEDSSEEEPDFLAALSENVTGESSAEVFNSQLEMEIPFTPAEEQHAPTEADDPLAQLREEAAADAAVQSPAWENRSSDPIQRLRHVLAEEEPADALHEDEPVVNAPARLPRARLILLAVMVLGFLLVLIALGIRLGWG